MVYQKLDQPEEAHTWEKKAADWFAEVNAHRPKEEADFMPPEMPLSDWLEYQVLRADAEKLEKP
jgi:hypothetical protein